MIAGIILGSTGEAVAGASISFVGAPVAVPDIALLSDADGTFALNAPVAGAYRLAIRAGERLKKVDLNVSPAGEAGIRIEV